MILICNYEQTQNYAALLSTKVWKKCYLPLDFFDQNSYYLIRGLILFTDCPLYLRNEGRVILHSFSSFETIQALPDIVTILELSQAIGLSHARTYQLLDERKIPYIRIQKRIIIFKEHLLEGLSQQPFYTDASKLNALANLPEVFPPNRLVEAFRISHGLAYIIAHSPGFPAVMERDRIIVDKHGLIRWIKKNEKYIWILKKLKT